MQPARSYSSLNELMGILGLSNKGKKRSSRNAKSLDDDSSGPVISNGKHTLHHRSSVSDEEHGLDIAAEDDSETQMSAQKRGSLGPPSSYSPIVSRKDLAQHPFSIPPGYGGHVSNSRGSLDLGHLDLAHYQNSEEDHEDKKTRRQTGISLGEVELHLRYMAGEDLLGVTVSSVSKLLLPSPSVIGSRWTCRPVVTMSLLPDKKKFFETKHPLELKDDTTSFVSIKSSEVADKTLRLTVFDSRRRNVQLAIGHVLQPLRELDPTGNTMSLVRQLTCYSEAAGFNKGKLELAVTWVVSAQKLEVKVGRAVNLKSPRGVLGREFFVKMFIFVGDQGTKTFKTGAIKATPDVDLKDKFVIPICSSQLKDSTFVFSLYAKHLVKLTLTSELIGSTVIGPYMPNRNRVMSQWEKMITSPFEEVSELHTLYI